MTLLSFLLTFFFMVVLSGPIIAGWYICTRGEWYIYPDGSFKKYGMIFKEWSLFWEQFSEKPLYYRGEGLRQKMDILKNTRPDARLYVEDDCWVRVGAGIFLGTDMIKSIENTLNIKIEHISQGNYRFYTMEPVYRFPKWLRKPLSECIICMASVYGSGIYWFIVLQVKGLFSWSAKENLAKFGFWVIFCLILACYNKFLQQKMRLDV